MHPSLAATNVDHLIICTISYISTHWQVLIKIQELGTWHLGLHDSVFQWSSYYSYAKFLRHSWDQHLHRYFTTVALSTRSTFNLMCSPAEPESNYYDVTGAGYCVEPNDVSYNTLLACNLMVSRNHNNSKNKYTMCPWATHFSNHEHNNHQFAEYDVPDVSSSKGFI